MTLRDAGCASSSDESVFTLTLHANVTPVHRASQRLEAVRYCTFVTVTARIIPASTSGMEWYLVIKTINGRRYRYRQRTRREGKRVRTESEYVGPEQLIGFHGTFAKFERFDESFLGSNTHCGSASEGFFFASNKNVAISYVSTHLARQNSLHAKMRTLEERIKALTGCSPYWVEGHLARLEPDVANKASTLYQSQVTQP
jgi:hypothetical protein